MRHCWVSMRGCHDRCARCDVLRFETNCPDCLQRDIDKKMKQREDCMTPDADTTPPPVEPIGLSPAEQRLAEFTANAPTMEQMCSSMGLPAELIGTAAPPPTEAQEPQGLCYVLSEAARKCEVYPVMSRTYQHSSNLAIPFEQKRLAAEARVKDLETTVAGQKLYIASCHIGIDNTLNELATLRTRLERAEEALREIQGMHPAHGDLMQSVAAAYFLPPSPGAVEAGDATRQCPVSISDCYFDCPVGTCRTLEREQSRSEDPAGGEEERS